MRIALLGTRGIPARYGGFETFAEELSTRLAARGHSISVYCREPHSEPRYRGVHLVHLRPWRHKYFETLHHTCLSTLHLLAHRPDVALYCNAANAIFTILPRLAGVPVALNVDGLERRRKKWNRLARLWYLLSERLATWLPTAIISDAEAIRDYYLRTYSKSSTFIPYGAPLGRLDSHAALGPLGLEPRRYFLYVTRFEPENNPLLVREAFEQVDTPLRLALVGDAPYAQAYIARVRATSDPRVLLPGAIYGDAYHELQSHSLAYVHATEVGGTHPALIEAMGRGTLVLYLDTPENREVAGPAGLPFTDRDSLSARMRQALQMSESERDAHRAAALERVRAHYGWDAVTSAYETLLSGLVR